MSTGKHGEHTHRRLEDVDRPVSFPPEKPSRAVQRKERQPPASQVNVIGTCRLRGLIAWLCLPIRRGDPAQVIDVIDAWHGAKFAPCRASITSLTWAGSPLAIGRRSHASGLQSWQGRIISTWLAGVWRSSRRTARLGLLGGRLTGLSTFSRRRQVCYPCLPVDSPPVRRLWTGSNSHILCIGQGIMWRLRPRSLSSLR